MHHLLNEEWVFLATVDTISGWLPQVTELPFCAGIELGRSIAPSTVFSQQYGKKTIIWGPFYGLKSKRLFRMNTDNISHVAIMTSLFTSHESVNDITQHFSLNSYLVSLFVQKCPTWNVDGKF